MALCGGVEVNVYLAFHFGSLIVFTEGKRQYVRVIVVVEVRLVEAAYGLVIAQHDAQVHQGRLFCLHDVTD
jgi:hypothetical protein